MVTVYPAGVNASWQGPSYAIEGVDGAAFTTDLIELIKESYCIDEKRVYATGHSNGGGFVGLLACSADHGGQFAAFAGVASALYTDLSGDETCSPSRSPLPMLESHGTADTTIPYNGGDGVGGKLPAIPDWLSRWGTRNKCTDSETIDKGNGLTEQRWTCDGTEGLQRHFKMEGQSHEYPGQANPQIWISPEIIGFFNAHSRP
ncbi:unnamed protein product [Clonostachys solani]|uniref:feruloyl esterase n=1 Tax=Clonostachys solani TaxID=160281 RepID=A0A9N9VZD7_9HYPO|nr:unnamed protein product [Clonostachys solani]